MKNLGSGNAVPTPTPDPDDGDSFFSTVLQRMLRYSRATGEFVVGLIDGEPATMSNKALLAPVLISPRIEGTPSYAAGSGAGLVGMGKATLVAGTVTVANTAVLATDNFQYSRHAAGGTLGQLAIASIVPGASFDIVSDSATETSDIDWRISRAGI